MKIYQVQIHKTSTIILHECPRVYNRLRPKDKPLLPQCSHSQGTNHTIKIITKYQVTKLKLIYIIINYLLDSDHGRHRTGPRGRTPGPRQTAKTLQRYEHRLKSQHCKGLR